MFDARTGRSEGKVVGAGRADVTGGSVEERDRDGEAERLTGKTMARNLAEGKTEKIDGNLGK